MALPMVPIYTQTANGSAVQITFNNIPQNFTDLLIKVDARDTRSGQATNRLRLYFNNDGSALYSCSVTGGNAASAFSFRETGSSNIPVGLMSSALATANAVGLTEIYIPNYTNNQFKSVLAETTGENNSSSSASEYLNFAAGLYRSTNAITRLDLLTESAVAFSNISTFTLYGILRAGA